MQFFQSIDLNISSLFIKVFLDIKDQVIKGITREGLFVQNFLSSIFAWLIFSLISFGILLRCHLNVIQRPSLTRRSPPQSTFLFSSLLFFSSISPSDKLFITCLAQLKCRFYEDRDFVLFIALLVRIMYQYRYLRNTCYMK